MEGLEIYGDGHYGVAPMQAEGKLPDGREFYFRARHSQISLDAPLGETLITLRVHIPYDDQHPVSGFDNRHVRPLIEFLYEIAESAREHAEQRKPYSWDRSETT